jgi:hypothetical protein
MKPTSPLSLLLFIRFATSLPLPLSHKTLALSSCGYESCREALTAGGPNTPPTRITDPHFPKHQLSSDSEDLIIDNHPITPTSHSISPDTLITAERPLTSAFLLSLAKPTSALIKISVPDQTNNALPSRPTSDLPALRREDLERFLEATSTDIQASWEGESEMDNARQTGCGGMEFTLLPKRYRVRQKASYVVREYSDVLVVGVVLLFLATVVCVEAVEKFGSM